MRTLNLFLLLVLFIAITNGNPVANKRLTSIESRQRREINMADDDGDDEGGFDDDGDDDDDEPSPDDGMILMVKQVVSDQGGNGVRRNV
ncbi:calsequestrin-2-like [Penaeus japonicus]|uniref:calsequestrin-2-like n=1 Tax=Penaeus japonicus TaxID=27405 RepID=UPI001C7167BB|nr:calsequestrin-2-like [Penaeus japonicus]